MNLLSALSEKTYLDKRSLVFSFSFQGMRYAVTENADGACECVRIQWNLWSGFYCAEEAVSDEVIRVCNRIFDLRDGDPLRYPFGGEHYATAITGEGESRRLRITRTGGRVLSGAAYLLPTVLRLLYAVLLALLWGFFLQREGVRWLPYLLELEDVPPNTLRYAVFAVSVVCTLLLFWAFTGVRSPISLYFNAILPIGTLVLLGVMKKLFVIALLAPLFVAVLYRCSARLNGSPSQRKRRGWRALMLRNALICLCVATVFAVWFGNVTPYDEKSDPPADIVLPQGVTEELRLRYEAACSELCVSDFREKSAQEKLEILQTICDYECIANFGCAPPTVCAGETKRETVLGHYVNATKTVTIRTDHLETGEADEVLNTLLHEIRHHMQYRMIDLYFSVEPYLREEYRNMPPFREAVLFWNNFNDYHSGEDDYELYYHQTVEEDSRRWASERLEWYAPFLYALGGESKARESCLE